MIKGVGADAGYDPDGLAAPMLPVATLLSDQGGQIGRN